MKQPPIAIPGHSVKDLEQNFFLPWTGSSGATHVLGFDRAVYEEIYPNVDMHFYSGSSGQKMAIVMRAGANPDDVRLQFTGQVSLRIDPWGQLRVYYNGRHFILREAVAYQVDQNNNIIPVNWTASYSLVSGGAAVRFGFSSYDPALPLVFQIGAPPAPGLGEAEPNLCWASYLGGTDYDEIESTTSDASGNHFFTGSFLSDFLTIPNNPGTEIIDGGQVVVVGKFNEQYHLDWLNYFGCSYQQNGLCIATGVQNGEQQVFIGGFVTYNDMVIEPLTGAYNLGSVSSAPFSLAFIARFDLDGQLNWSTYFMNGTSELRGMDIDASGRLHVVGRAQNQNIPVTTPGGASSWGFVGGTGDYNTLLARFNANNQLEWCTTYPAGVGHDVVCTSDGFTVSGIGRSGMPTIDPGVPAYYQPASGGNGDALLMRFSTNALCTWATFFGGDGDDLPGQNGLAANTYGDVYFVGNTTSTTAFPLVGANDMSNANGEDGFIARIAAGTQALTWCSYANGKLEAVTTDPDNNVYAAGTTTDPNFPILFSEDLYNSGTLLSYHDGCILGFTATNTQFYGTFFGGESTPVQEGIVGIQYTLNRLLVASTVRKEMVTDYQPLYFPDFIAYYDDYYDFELGQFGLNTNTLDGHFASICRFVVGWEEHPTQSDGRFVVQHMADEQFRWSGLVDGTYDWNLLDASGRLLNTGKLTAHGEPGTFRCPTPADGLYLVTMRSGKQMFTARTVVTR